MYSIEGLTFNNTYYLMRHGKSISNVRGIVSSKNGINPLTRRGRQEVEKQARRISHKVSFDKIFCSPLLRTRLTSRIVSKHCANTPIIFDKRLAEINVGIFEGKPLDDYNSFFGDNIGNNNKGKNIFYSGYSVNAHVPGGESLNDVQKCIVSFLREINKTYSGLTFLIVSHGDPLCLLRVARKGIKTRNKLWASIKKLYMRTGEIVQIQ